MDARDFASGLPVLPSARTAALPAGSFIDPTTIRSKKDMPRSKSEIYLHFVWATHQRMPLVTQDIESALYACIHAEAKKLDCEILAVGGMPDHVHLALRVPTKVSSSQIMQRVKGVSSMFTRDKLLPGQFFGWQDNYAVFSLSRPHRDRVVAYILNQKQNHADNTLWPQWEETDEEV